MVKRPYIKSFVSDVFHAAIAEWCEENGKEVSQETRRMWSRRIGRPEFANEKKMGRPVKDD